MSSTMYVYVNGAPAPEEKNFTTPYDYGYALDRGCFYLDRPLGNLGRARDMIRIRSADMKDLVEWIRSTGREVKVL